MIDRIAGELERFTPMLLQTAGIRNGSTAPSPSRPTAIPSSDRYAARGYWVACGVMAGFLQGGGVGKALAEWMIHGEPEADVFGMDIARYGAFASNREYIRQTTGNFTPAASS